MSDADMIDEAIASLRAARDSRLGALETAVAVDAELASCRALQIVLVEAEKQATAALEALAIVNPADMKRIIELQSIWYRFKFIKATLNNVLFEGKLAQESLNGEAMRENDE